MMAMFGPVITASSSTSRSATVKRGSSEHSRMGEAA